MRFGDWVKLVLMVIVCLVLGALIGGGIGAGFGPTAGVLVGLFIAFGIPWMGFLAMRSGSKCAACGKKWSLEDHGYQDGDITELHERNSSGELKLVHKWDRYQDWKCKNCGDETTQVVEQKKTV